MDDSFLLTLTRLVASELAKPGILGPQNNQGIGRFDDTTSASAISPIIAFATPFVVTFSAAIALAVSGSTTSFISFTFALRTFGVDLTDPEKVVTLDLFHGLRQLRACTDFAVNELPRLPLGVQEHGR